MGKGYEAPLEVRELEKMIDDFTYKHGLDVQNVFRDLLRYIIHGFSLPDTPPLSDWRYTKEQNRAFYDMYVTWTQIMQKQIARQGYYDAFGDLYMALTSKRGQQQSGQFFTSTDVSRLCQEIVMNKNGNGNIQSIYDPAAGSGRMLIASKADNPRSYLVAWDIDYTCCLMCVCNFLMNSCIGEVVCIDSLRMDNFRGAWLVNEAYYRAELPSVRWLNEAEYCRFKQADIPPELFFCDQKRYDDYFKMRETIAHILKIFEQVPGSSEAGDEAKENQSA
ncbi:N-6 DNA methylase [Alistipes timonensis]